jgi:Rab family, other
LQIKYVGEEDEKKGMEMSGLNLMDKVLMVRGASIALSIWDVGGIYVSLSILLVGFFLFSSFHNFC